MACSRSDEILDLYQSLTGSAGSLVEQDAIAKQLTLLKPEAAEAVAAATANNALHGVKGIAIDELSASDRTSLLSVRHQSSAWPTLPQELLLTVCTQLNVPRCADRDGVATTGGGDAAVPAVRCTPPCAVVCAEGGNWTGVEADGAGGGGGVVDVDWPAYMLACARDPWARCASRVFGITEEICGRIVKIREEKGDESEEDENEVLNDEDEGKHDEEVEEVEEEEVKMWC
ncbi:hypothetical protein DFJ73DRAFT_772222 [Zopfochytrium polystomum]|nr:hypothetical protein DFJ73DRAFT_772222 [Zopfochytrium polystomum]